VEIGWKRFSPLSDGNGSFRAAVDFGASNAVWSMDSPIGTCGLAEDFVECAGREYPTEPNQ
jgi:hypothetical protein